MYFKQINNGEQCTGLSKSNLKVYSKVVVIEKNCFSEGICFIVFVYIDWFEVISF